MSVYGKWTAATIASGATESAALDLGRAYDVLLIQIPAVNGGGTIFLKVAETTGGTYYTLGGSDITLYEMSVFKKPPKGEDESDEEAQEDYEEQDRADSIRLGGWRFVKVCTAMSPLATWSIRVCGMSY
jgi:hypothetical protein